MERKELQTNENYEYRNVCRHCGASISSLVNEQCPDCGRYICWCGACSRVCEPSQKRIRFRIDQREQAEKEERRRQAEEKQRKEDLMQKERAAHLQKMREYYSVGKHVIFQGLEYVIESFDNDKKHEYISIRSLIDNRPRKFEPETAYRLKSLEII